VTGEAAAAQFTSDNAQILQKFIFAILCFQWIGQKIIATN